MPQYDFECRECRRVFEVQATVSEYTAMRRERRITCPACGTTKVTRVFCAPNIGASSSTPRQGGACCCPGGQCE